MIPKLLTLISSFGDTNILSGLKCLYVTPLKCKKSIRFISSNNIFTRPSFVKSDFLK